jgi:hypothetical protein
MGKAYMYKNIHDELRYSLVIVTHHFYSSERSTISKELAADEGGCT